MKRHILTIQDSETMAANERALARARSGARVYKLNVGEPMVPAPRSIIRSVARALTEGKTHYPPVSGIPELRETAARFMSRTYGASYASRDVLVTTGAKFGIYLLLQALLRRGDEVLIPAPFWVSYPSMVRIFGARPRLIGSSPRSGWKISPDDIRRHATSKTKILILNNGSNPTGVLYSRSELGAILAVANRKGIFVISDEVYSELVYDGSRYVSAGSFPRLKKGIAVVQSASKNFALTGLRVGFVFVKDTALMTSITNLMTQSATGVATLSQYAALAALEDAKRVSANIRAAMRKRRATFLSSFEKAFGVKLSAPASALYAFVPLSAMGVSGRDSNTFCRRALDEAGVALVPGRAFGAEGYVRFSFGGDISTITNGVLTLGRWIQREARSRASAPQGRRVRRKS